MATTDPYAGFGTKQTPQMESVPGRSDQVKNNAGGFVFQIDPLTQLRRFLTIGSAGGTFYVGPQQLTRENGEMILELTKTPENHRILVDEIVNISLSGRAPKQNPALFALAIACQHGETESKQYARSQITKVVRTGTHLFIFVRYLKQFGGWSRGLRKAVGGWYVEKKSDKLALQLVKYRQREGYTHRDVLRMAHPKIGLSAEMKEIDKLVTAGEIEPTAEFIEACEELSKKRSSINWVLHGDDEAYRNVEGGMLPDTIKAYESANAPRADIPAILGEHYLPWEALPDSAMNDPRVWDKMLDNGMPLTALMRQLPRLTNLGMLPQMGGRTAEVVERLCDEDLLAQARIHPINVLVAMKTYASGHGKRSSWQPTAKIIDGLDEMFYRSFGFVQPTGKRTLLAIDISSSMWGSGWGSWSQISDDFPLCPGEVAAAMALTTAKVEPENAIFGFSSLSGRSTRDPKDSLLVPLGISPRQRLDDVMRSTRDRIFGGTDCALPMITAIKQGWPVDTFVVYTDNETWHGDIHPFQALQEYRRMTQINAKLIVVGMTATQFSIADPTDPGMLDISGFDSACPSLISDFSAGVL